MAITYSAGAGTQITTYAMNETLIAQTDQINNNTVVVSDIPSVAGNGNIGDGTAGQGPGDTYAGRIIIINLGLSTEQTRFCSADAASTGNTRLLTVDEDWDVNPVATDTIHVFYTGDDIENGGAGGGVTYQTRTGFFEFSNELFVGSGGGTPAGLQISGELYEISDTKSTTVYGFTIRDGGRFQSGYIRGGQAIKGGYMIGVQNGDGEPFMDLQSGSEYKFYDFRIIGSVATLEILTSATGAVADRSVDNFSMFQVTWEAVLFNSSWKNGSITGSGNAAEFVRLDSNSVQEGIVLINTAGYHTTDASTTTETLTVRDIVWSGNVDDITINSNKTWNVINPDWLNTAASYTALNFLTATGNRVNEKYSLDLTVVDPSGTAITDAGVFFYEGLETDDLEIIAFSDVDGGIADSWLFTEYLSASATEYGNHALRVYKYGKNPFIAAQTSDVPFSGAVTLTADSAITEASQSTALTNGAGITPVHHATGETDPRPLKVLNYDGGTGSVPTVGETITQGSATGVVVEYLGDAVSGTLVLETWNGTEFTDNQTMSGGTSSFNGVTDLVGGTSFYQEYSWEIDCNSKALTVVYDYLAAEMAGLGSPIISALYEQLHEWGGSEQGQALYSGTAGYFTLRALQEFGSPDSYEGVWLSNRGGGTIAYMTSDANVQYTPAVTYTHTLNNIQENTEITYVTFGSPRTELFHVEDVDGTGITEFTYSGLVAGTEVDILVHHINYQPDISCIYNFTLPASNASAQITQFEDANYINPSP